MANKLFYISLSLYSIYQMLIVEFLHIGLEIEKPSRAQKPFLFILKKLKREGVVRAFLFSFRSGLIILSTG